MTAGGHRGGGADAKVLRVIDPADELKNWHPIGPSRIAKSDTVHIGAPLTPY